MKAATSKWVLLAIAHLAIICCGEDEAASEAKGPVIGIDLGTTFSCVAVMRSSGVEIIPNDQGNRITPSFVAFTEQGRLIGEAAKNEAALRPSNTLFDIKRLIGRRLDDKSVQEDIKVLPYKIMEDDDKLKIAVAAKGEIKYMTPEEISSMVLAKMKQVAETFLGEEVKSAVITVPAYFTNAQREATRDAGTLAGLNVMRIINEPTAAALAYGLDKKNEINVLVYDLGGGTFDVSLLTVADGVIEVVATSGDTHLGGEDFDQRLAQYLKDNFEEKNGVTISKDKKALYKLKEAAEKAKIDLSSKSETTIEVEGLAGGVDFVEKISRAKFEELNIDLFKKTLAPVKQVLEDGKLQKKDIDEIVMVGGSTRIPKVVSLMKNFFNGKEPNVGLNPDEAVAYGAAVQGGILSGVADKDIVLLDVTPITLGIETNGGIFDKMVPRNSATPVRKTKSFQTSQPDTTYTHIKVFEGERRLVKDCNKLGEFVLSGFPQGPAGIKHDVTFDIDVNGIMTVSAKITSSGMEESMTISKDKSRLTSEQIEDMIKDAETYEDDDGKAVDRIKSRNELELFIGESKRKLKAVSSKIPPDEKEKVESLLAEGKEMANNAEGEKEDLDNKLEELKPGVAEILDKYDADEEEKEEEDDDDFDVHVETPGPTEL